jgi:hypothetical protein
VTGSVPRSWVLPSGVTLRVDDVVVLDDRDDRFGRGVVRLRIKHVGDSEGRVHPRADWVTLIGHEVGPDGELVGPGRQLSARVRAVRPLRR